MNIEVHEPTGTKSRGAVILVYGVDGFTDNLTGPWQTRIRDYAQQLAKDGFTAIIPDYFAVTDTTPGAHVVEQILLLRPKWQQALVDVIAHAKTLPLVDGARVGFLGFSLGGHLSLRTRRQAKVLVVHFAPVIDGIGGAGSLVAAEIHHGDDDDLVPHDDNAPKIKSTLTGEGVPTTLFSYPGANHGFIGTDTDNAKAYKDSRERTLAFFRSHL